MKKTMFITSVIMVVVMAIALTTSSLAWFSAAGTDTVSTANLQLTAKASSATGLAISVDRDNWVTEGLILEASTGSAESDLYPLVPFTKTAKYGTGVILDSTAEGYDADLVVAENARVKAALITALLGGAETAYVQDTNQNYGTAADTSYQAYMIGAKIAGGGQFNDDVQRTGFFTEDIYIKNMSSGSSAANVKFSTEISFYTVEEYEEGGQTKHRDVEYNSTKRGAKQYQNDAVLCVAVLARIDEFDTDGNIEANATQTAGTFQTAGAYANPEKWEIVAYAASKGSNINIGGTDANFKAGQYAASSYATVAASTLGLNPASNTEILRPARQGNAVELPATEKTLKVIAWYDGATLNNNNSEQMDLKFNISFTKVALS